MFRLRVFCLLSNFLILIVTLSREFAEASDAQNEHHVREFGNQEPSFKKVSRCICGASSFNCCNKAKRSTLVKVGLYFTFIIFNGIITRDGDV